MIHLSNNQTWWFSASQTASWREGVSIEMSSSDDLGGPHFQKLRSRYDDIYIYIHIYIYKEMILLNWSITTFLPCFHRFISTESTVGWLKDIHQASLDAQLNRTGPLNFQTAVVTTWGHGVWNGYSLASVISPRSWDITDLISIIMVIIYIYIYIYTYIYI